MRNRVYFGSYSLEHWLKLLRTGQTLYCLRIRGRFFDPGEERRMMEEGWIKLMRNY